MLGFQRPSAAGPRLEVSATVPGSPIVASSKSSTLATVNAFFATPGNPTVPAPEPSLPAEKTYIWSSDQIVSSSVRALASVPNQLPLAPQELLTTCGLGVMLPLPSV